MESRRRFRICSFIMGALAASALGAVVALAVGSVTLTSTSVGRRITKHTIVWTSDAAGAVSGNGATLASIDRGAVVQIELIPGSAGNQPTDLYDVTLVDDRSVDYLQGVGANLSNSTSKLVLFDPPIHFDDSFNLDLVVANAGNAKQGTVIVYIGETP